MLALLQTVAKSAAKPRHAFTPTDRLTRYFFRLGFLGVFFICIIDSSPIPLPIPGSSDILVTLIAAQRQEWFVVTLIATLGSVIGAAISYHAGRIGGFALLDRYVAQRFRDTMRRWIEEHSILSTALPAILPPPAPLMPFLIAAGALNMPQSRFYTSFTISRFLRHAFFAWLGLHYGRHIMPVYLRFAEKYGWILLVVVWGSIAFGIIYALLKLRHNRRLKAAATATAAA
jgi:membrane protein YqaA with SNARE-associated domain